MLQKLSTYLLSQKAMAVSMRREGREQIVATCDKCGHKYLESEARKNSVSPCPRCCNEYDKWRKAQFVKRYGWVRWATYTLVILMTVSAIGYGYHTYINAEREKALRLYEAQQKDEREKALRLSKAKQSDEVLSYYVKKLTVPYMAWLNSEMTAHSKASMLSIIDTLEKQAASDDRLSERGRKEIASAFVAARNVVTGFAGKLLESRRENLPTLLQFCVSTLNPQPWACSDLRDLCQDLINSGVTGPIKGCEIWH